MSEAGKHYGENIIGKYAELLMIEVNKKYNRRTLFRMRQFYFLLLKLKVSPVATQLTWSHYTELLSIKDFDKLKYYIYISITQNLSKRELRERIKNQEYSRISPKVINKLILKENVNVQDLVPNPILIKIKNNIDIINESVLHNLIMEDIELFMNELGNNFSFIGSEYKIKFNNKYNYIDILLFNFEFNCFVVVELKVTELKKEHIGQIQIYMNYIDKNLKKVFHNNTVGIIICKKNNQYVIDYCSDDRIISRKYSII